MSNREVEINLTAGGRGTVKVGDTDLTSIVAGLAIDTYAGGRTRLTLDLVPHEIAVTGEVEAEVPSKMRHALIALGWVPPDQARALLRQDGGEA